MPPISNDISFSRLLGALYTEVFQRKAANPNKPITASRHAFYEQVVRDDIRTTLDTETNVFTWGPGGASDETDSTPLSTRWSFTGQWG